MSLTTIQVDSTVRDRLRVLADAAGTSIGGLVGELAASTLTPKNSGNAPRPPERS